MIKFIVYFFLFIIIVRSDTVFDLPSVDYDDEIDFYLLESSFPFNVPQNIK
jgi:hypothetical protein